MKNYLVLALLGFAVLAPGTSLAQHQSARSQTAPSPKVLSVIFQGPFVFWERSADVVLLIPDLMPEHEPLRIGRQDLPTGSYEFCLTQPCSWPTAASVGGTVHAVGGTQALWYKDPALTPQQSLYTIRLPKPKKIIPWNADPIEVIRGTASGVERLATVHVFQYEVAALNEVHVASTSAKFKPRLKIINSQEAVMSFWLEPNFEEDEDHYQARAAFAKMKWLFGIPDTGLKIDFPKLHEGEQDGRNMPLLKKDEISKQLAKKLKELTRAWIVPYRSEKSPLEVLAGPLLDCRAPQLYISATDVNSY